MYVDGELDRTFTANGSMTALGSGSPLTRYGLVGDGSEASTEGGTGNLIFYTGDIAIIQMYLSTLSPHQIRQNYLATRGRYI